MLLSVCIDSFILDRKSRGFTSSTVYYYRQCLSRFLSFVGDTDVAAVSLSDCLAYSASLRELGTLSSVSVQTYIRGVRAFLSWAYQFDYIPKPLTNQFRLPKAQRMVIDVLTDDEILAIYGCFSDTFHGFRNLCMVSLMLGSGLRRNEVLTLRVDSLHIAEGYCRVDGKCQKQRLVPLAGYTCELLRKYMQCRPPSIYVFCKSNGEPLTKDTIKYVFRVLRQKSGVERLHPHLLRHSFATRYLESGGDIYSLQKILGHSSLDMVKKYLHLSQSFVNETFLQYSPLDRLQSNNVAR